MLHDVCFHMGYIEHFCFLVWEMFFHIYCTVIDLVDSHVVFGFIDKITVAFAHSPL